MKKSILSSTVILLIVCIFASSGCAKTVVTTSSTTESSSGIQSAFVSQTELSETSESSVAVSDDFIIYPAFDEAFSFNSAGFAVVGEITEGKMLYGIIDETGAYVIEPCFDAFLYPDTALIRYVNLDDRFIWVRKDSQWSIINESGQWLSDQLFEDCTCFSDNGLAGVRIDGEWGFCDNTGEIVIEPRFSGVSFFHKNGAAAVCLDGKWGTVDSTGTILVEPQFSNIAFEGDLTEMFLCWDNGDADVYMIDDGQYLYGLISDTGEILAEPQFLFPFLFADIGLAQVVTEKGCAYINTAGVIVIEEYDAKYASRFYSGYATIEKASEDGKSYYQFIDKYGRLISSTPFDSAGNFAPNGLAAAAVDGEYGYIDNTGEFVIDPQFDHGRIFDENGYAVVRDGGKFAILYESGLLMTDFIYDECYRTWSNFEVLPYSSFAVLQDGQWGLIGERGNVLIEPQFDEICFSDSKEFEGYHFFNLSEYDLAMVKTGGKRGIISLTGEVLLPPIAEQESLRVSSNGMVAVCVGEKYGYARLDI